MSAGAAAAAAEQRRMCEEEEEMTPYSATDLSHDWEFKILRSATGGFRNTEWLRQVLEEEAQAGWMLIEKFDNSRVRLKRSAAARERDGKLHTDPYRTYVGMSPQAMGLVVASVAVGAMLTILLFIFTITRR